jgi:hypothetical protein
MLSLGFLFWFVLAPLVLAAVVLTLDFSRTLPVEPYTDGVSPVYIGRAYRNDPPEPALAGYRVVPVPRHLRYDVVLELSQPGRVLRLLSEKNDNAVFDGWERMDALRVNVFGRTCVLTRAVGKDFAPGVHHLAPGGPVAAAPVLVASAGEVRARTTSTWNKLTPARDPVRFVMSNKRKLATLALAYASWCGLVWWLR